MRGWDSVTRKGRLRPGPAAIIVLLAGLLLSLAPTSQQLENAVYDIVQRVSAGDAGRDIVLVDTQRLPGAAANLWEAERLPELLNRLGQAHARLVVMVDSPPLTAALPGAAQLATLAEIERRSRLEDAAAPSPGAFDRQVDAMRRRAQLHDRTIDAVKRLRNVIIAVPTIGGTATTTSTATSCRKYLLEPAPSGNLADVTAATRAVGAIASTPEDLCAAILGAGHVSFWPDADRVVRRFDLLVSSGGNLVPSAALRAVAAISGAEAGRLVVSDAQIEAGARRIHTSDRTGMLARFHSEAYPLQPFRTIEADELLRGPVPTELVAAKIVILGSAAARSNADLLTPLGTAASSALLLATGLANLLQGDYIVRPAWLPIADFFVLAGIGVVVLAWGGRLRPLVALASGLGAALGLLVAEAMLLRAGTWVPLATAAIFVLCAVTALQLLQARPQPAADDPEAPARITADGMRPAVAGLSNENELDLAFSMLRHQTPSEHVKRRLYEISLEHARRHDLAKAERVLRHLAGVDPQYRQAAEKLRKLGGLRSGRSSPARGASGPEPGAGTPAPEQPPANLSGRTIGRYQVEQLIGRGAMASVYLGLDPKINRRVAIKLIALAEEFSDSDIANARTQFLREAESAGRLNHPNIIGIYDAGEDGDFAYLAMEYFAGRPLSHYAQQGQLLPAERVLEIVARAADALNYAHNQHVVHRDVKPANLLYDAETDTLKITDFGIARLTDASRTKTGIVLGTPSYMSPEQLAGQSVSGQSDLFSLGITLYQLLTGAPPFRADSIPRLMQKIAQEPHPSVRQLREDLPADIDDIIDKALAKDPADRFANGRAMALALRDCCSRLRLSAAGRSA